MRTPVEIAVRAVLDALVAHRNNLTRAGDYIALGPFQYFARMRGTAIVVWHSRRTDSSSLAAASRWAWHHARKQAPSAMRSHRLRTGNTEVGQPVERRRPMKCGSRHGNVPFKRAPSVSLARSQNVSSHWPDRQVADMPRPAINAFGPSARMLGYSLVGARRTVPQSRADICLRNGAPAWLTSS